MNVSSWSIRNPIPAILLFVLLTLIGVMGFNGMKIQQFPDVDLPMVTVTEALPGASPALTSMRSPTRRPTPILVWITRLPPSRRKT